MDTNSPPESALDEAIRLVGLLKLAAECGVTYQAVRKWQRVGMPRSEWTGESHYAATIERLTAGQVTAARLLSAGRPARARAAAGGGDGTAQEAA